MPYMTPKLMVFACRRWSSGDQFREHPHEDRGRFAVDVLSLPEGFCQHRVPRHVRHDPQLDLRIIGAEQDMSRRRDEGFADFPAQFGPDRDVLEVGVG